MGKEQFEGIKDVVIRNVKGVWRDYWLPITAFVVLIVSCQLFSVKVSRSLGIKVAALLITASNRFHFERVLDNNLEISLGLARSALREIAEAARSLFKC